MISRNILNNSLNKNPKSGKGKYIFFTSPYPLSNITTQSFNIFKGEKESIEIWVTADVEFRWERLLFPIYALFPTNS